MALDPDPLRDGGAIASLGDNNPPEPIDDSSEPVEDLNFWHALIDEKAAAKFWGVTPRYLQQKRQTGGGPPFIRLGSRLVKYRRIDLRRTAEKCLRRSTADPGPETETK